MDVSLTPGLPGRLTARARRTPGAGPRRLARARLAAVLVGAGLAAAALALVARTLGLVYMMARPMPYWDAWEFMKALPAIEDGRYGLRDLFAFHNEHRIVTTRLIMLLDLRAFAASGYLSTALVAATLMVIGALLGVVAAGRRWIAWVPAAVVVSLLLSVAHSDNFSSGFQVQFPLVDLFAIGAIGLFALSARSPAARWPLLAGAVLADALAIGSMASGNLVVGPVLLVALALRARLLPTLAFLTAALGMTAAYLIGYPGSETPPSHDAGAIAHFVLNFLGAALRGYPHAPLVLGIFLLFTYLGVMAAMVRTWARREALDPVSAWLAGVATFVMLGAAVTGVGRAKLGLEASIASRYAIQSLLFIACLFLMAWRWLGLRSSSVMARLAFAAVALVASAASTLSSRPLADWRQRVDDYDAAGTAFASGVFSDRAISNVYPLPDLVRPTIGYMAAHRLGPFSPSRADVYRPPVNAAVEADVAALPRCVAAFDRVLDVGPGWREIDGWLFDGRTPGAEGGWILAYDGARRLIGFAARGVPRPDVASAYALSAADVGFRLSLRAAGEGGQALGETTLVLVPDGPDGAGCAAAAPLASR